MAGGTGGHVFPALALARELRARSWQVVWLGTRRGLEARLVPAEHFPIEWLSVSGLRGKGSATWLPRRCGCCARCSRRWRSCAGAGRGGRRAWGLTPRARGHGCVADAPAAADPRAERDRRLYQSRAWRIWRGACSTAFPGELRTGVSARDRQSRARARSPRCHRRRCALPTRSGPIRMLVVGGSQGAARLNAVVPFALARVTDAPARSSPPGRASAARSRAPPLRGGRLDAELHAVHRGHGGRLRLGRPGDLPRRRADGLRARGRRCRRDPGAVPGGDRRSPDPQRARVWWRRARR